MDSEYNSESNALCGECNITGPLKEIQIHFLNTHCVGKADKTAESTEGVLDQNKCFEQKVTENENLVGTSKGKDVTPKKRKAETDINRRHEEKMKRVDKFLTLFQLAVEHQIGNQMWKYSTIWAIARHTGLAPYVPKCLKKELEKVFEELQMPTLEEIAHCPIEYNTFVKSFYEWQHPSQNIILVTYNFHKTLVLKWLDSIVQEFKFRKEIRDTVQEILRDFVKTRPPKQYTFVAVHVRRADYIRYLKKKYGERPVDPSFFKKAMEYFRNKYPNCLFIYVSDDPMWCFENFGQLEDVYVASYAKNTTAAEDLAIMAACNHTIFDYGTFGQWGSILAGGETVYSNMEPNFSNGSMSNWIMIEG